MSDNNKNPKPATSSYLLLTSASKYAETMSEMEEDIKLESELGLMLYTPAGRYIGVLSDRKDARNLVKTDGEKRRINFQHHLDTHEVAVKKLDGAFNITDHDSVVYLDNAVFLPSGSDQIVHIDNVTLFTKQVVGYSFVSLGAFETE